MKKYWWLVVVLIVVIVTIGLVWFLVRPNPAITTDNSQPGLLPSQVSTTTTRIANLNPFVSEKQKIEANLAKFKVDPKIISYPELFSESSLSGWKEGDQERGRYQIIGTVSDYQNGMLSLNSREKLEIKTDSNTIFACVEPATIDTPLKDYTQMYTDYQGTAPFDVQPYFLQTQFNMSTYTQDAVVNRVLKNSWAYVWVAEENWTVNSITASVVILTYCLF